ncbi:ferrous iron transport protein A [Glutamicibacter halophytocola]|uniref:Ferrous iron transport protein A n=2 Tax=Micrococcaceae TaxID=1268 RepID=A0ABX5Y6L2_9MICC|nr:ferrous iron transport protein A [Glutamicibacter sp. FBE19]NQD39762.1 ferrous iron transport protein A [Glutamicibacter halophytocola]QDY65753.1 ferrous iron transport protein A [Glutamicibacter halophytocola]
MLSFSDMTPGERLVVRYRLPVEASTASGRFSDALGELREVTADSISVQTRSGLVVIPRALITHAKLVPPAPQRRRPRTPRN